MFAVIDFSVTLEYREYGRWVAFAVTYNGLVVITIFYLLVGQDAAVVGWSSFP